MAYRIERAAEVRADLLDISIFLARIALDLGDSPDEALAGARRRLAAINDAIDGLARVPHQGTLLPSLRPGLRSVTKDRAVFYFELDEAAERLRVLAVFYGGQDHRSHMLRRLSR